MILLTLAIFLYFLYLFLEHRANARARSSFLHVIHVNGIRGKTGTCRTLDAVLRAKYKVFTKTTGTDAAVIDVSGREMPIRRIGPASIGEQIRILRRARKEGAEILVIECMAVNPVLQRAAQEQIVMGDISVITNVRYDHILDMGETKEEISASLSAVIPDHGLLVTADPEAEAHFGARCRERGTELLAVPSEGDSSDNRKIAEAIASRLGITGEQFLRQLSLIHEDFGVRRLYQVSGPDGVPYRFLNLFSVNDPESTESNLQKTLKELDIHGGKYGSEGLPPSPVCFLYNHRMDRPDRALLFARHFFPLHRDIPLYLCGPGLPLAERLFSGAGVKDIRRLKKPPGADKKNLPDPQAFLPSLPEGTLLVGIGNIKGIAYSLIEQLNRGDAS